MPGPFVANLTLCIRVQTWVRKASAPDGRMISMRHNRMQFTRVTLVGVLAMGLLVPALAANAASGDIQRAQITALVAPMNTSVPSHFNQTTALQWQTFMAAEHAARVKAQRVAASAAARKARAALVAQARAAQLRAARARAALVPSRSHTSLRFGTVGYSKWFARAWISYKYHWDTVQFGCLNALWIRESGWSTHSYNSSSGAYGIPQAMPGSKMATGGSNWRTNPETQIRWGANYIRARYGTPCSAWSHSRWYGWY